MAKITLNGIISSIYVVSNGHGGQAYRARIFFEDPENPDIPETTREYVVIPISRRAFEQYWKQRGPNPVGHRVDIPISGSIRKSPRK